MKPRVPVIHIGMPKTASKTLQWYVFAQHSEIYYLGRYDGYIFDKKYRQFAKCRDEHVHQVMSNVAYHGIHEAVSDETRSQFRQYLDRNNTDNRLPVWSWESYCTDRLKNRIARADNLKALFGEARIFASIRHPVKLLESAYLQQLKRDNVGAKSKKGRPVFFPGIDDWVARNQHDDIDNHLDYARTIGLYVDRFGLENVCVLPMESLIADQHRYFDTLCRFMGIGLEETLKLVSNQVANQGWSDTQLQCLAAIKASPRMRWRFRFASKTKRRQMLGLGKRSEADTSSGRARVAMQAENREKIIEQTREGNEWLQEQFGLNLEQYGYMNP